MRQNLCALVISLTLAISGCGSSEETTPQQGPAPAKAAAENAIQATEKAAEAVATKTAEMEKQLEAAAKDAGQEASRTVKEAGDSTRAMAAAAEQKLETAAVATAQAVQETAKDVKIAMAPERLTLQASYGEVSFPHAAHAASFACKTCHGEGTPAAFGLSKETAHPLCKGCHQEQGAGPTACTGCHKKP